MDRSPGFGSTAYNYIALLRLGFPSAPMLQHLNLAAYHNSLVRSTKSTWSLALPLLVSYRFQVLFHSPPGVLFTFPSRYCFAIGHWVVFSLGGWAPLLQTGFHVSGPTLVLPLSLPVSPTGVSPSMLHLSRVLRLPSMLLWTVHNPICKQMVWALSRSLAATRKIDVSFSSWGYLDVSVHPVAFL